MRNFIAFLFAAGAALLLQSGAAWAIGEDVFVVPRVPVQAQADSATAAKAVAQMQGRQRAMDILLRRLTIEKDWIYLPKLAAQQPADAAPVAAPAADPNAAYDPYAQAKLLDSGVKTPIALTDEDLEGLESSFEVYAEKSSATTYRAYITYRFKPDAVRKLLKNAHIPYSETQTRTALVLPVLQTENGVYLWEQNNPWMAAWKARPLNNELTPMAAPLGDLEDAALITAQDALALDPDKLAAIAEHYSVSQVIVAHARLRQQNGQDQLTVRLINGYRETATLAPSLEIDPALLDLDDAAAPAPAQPEKSPEDDFTAKVGDILAQNVLTAPSGNFPTLAEDSIEQIIANYASGWKALTLIDHSTESVLETTAFFSSLADWTKIRAGLVATPLVSSVQVFALSPRGAEMRLKVFGDPRRLAVTMENYGVTFWSEDKEHWFLATPALANQLSGSRRLRRSRGGLFGEATPQDGDQPVIEPASASQFDDQAAPETKIEQHY